MDDFVPVRRALLSVSDKTSLEYVAAISGLRAMRAHPSFAGLVLTEVNPTHDADGSQLGRYVRGLAGALAATEDNR